MTPDVVVDIGNTRFKFGWCSSPGTDFPASSLPPDSPLDWESHLQWWGVRTPVYWAAAGVHPARLERFARWVESRRETLLVIDSFRKIPIELDVEAPERVGIDRLLDAVAAVGRVPAGTPAVVADVGTAVTVDLVDKDRVFRGGAILPGPRLMAEALREKTARLPLVDAEAGPIDDTIGRDTESAIALGIWSAVAGAVSLLASEYAKLCPSPWLLLTGGAAEAVAPLLAPEGVARVLSVPTLTLEGIRLAAEALP